MELALKTLISFSYKCSTDRLLVKCLMSFQESVFHGEIYIQQQKLYLSILYTIIMDLIFAFKYMSEVYSNNNAKQSPGFKTNIL